MLKAYLYYIAVMSVGILWIVVLFVGDRRKANEELAKMAGKEESEDERRNRTAEQNHRGPL